MRFLILNVDYPDFINWLYTKLPGLEKQPFGEQMKMRNESLNFRADFYSENLRKLGHEAHEIYANNKYIQTAWAREHGIVVKDPTPIFQARPMLLRARRYAAATPLHYLVPRFRPLRRLVLGLPPSLYHILAAQIKHYKPDVLINTSMFWVGSTFLKTMKPYVHLLVGQAGTWHINKLLELENLHCYDLIVSPRPPPVQWFREKGVPAELLRLGFEPRVLSYLTEHENATIPTSFVGAWVSFHNSRVALLENLCVRFDIQVWGPGIEAFPRKSAIRKAYMGQAWGLEMYQILARSKITLNHHGDIPPYASNMRLYEATGVGTLLITDWKENLHELFEPDKEVVAYRSADECAELIQYYLDHEAEREAIARAGHQRTLKDHTYFRRMAELVDIVSTYL